MNKKLEEVTKLLFVINLYLIKYDDDINKKELLQKFKKEFIEPEMIKIIEGK